MGHLVTFRDPGGLDGSRPGQRSNYHSNPHTPCPPAREPSRGQQPLGEVATGSGSMTIPPYLRRSTDPRRQIPCWPNQPRIVVFLTRDLDRFTGPYLLARLPFVFIVLFLFDHVIGD